MDRRQEASLRTQARSDQLLIEEAATARVLATADLVRIVDQYLLGFEKELRDGRVKTDSAADFDRFARLRELLVGGVDSRTELTGTLTLEAIQQRHRQLRGQVASATPELTGTATPHTSGDDDGDTAMPQLAHSGSDAAASAPASGDHPLPAEAITAADSGASAPAAEPPRLQVDVDPAAAAESRVAVEPGAHENYLPAWVAAADDDDLPVELAEVDDEDLVAERADFGGELAGEEEA